jgi:hypothetical protein
VEGVGPTSDDLFAELLDMQMEILTSHLPPSGLQMMNLRINRRSRTRRRAQSRREERLDIPLARRASTGCVAVALRSHGSRIRLMGLLWLFRVCWLPSWRMDIQRHHEESKNNPSALPI